MLSEINESNSIHLSYFARANSFCVHESFVAPLIAAADIAWDTFFQNATANKNYCIGRSYPSNRGGENPAVDLLEGKGRR